MFSLRQKLFLGHYQVELSERDRLSRNKGLLGKRKRDHKEGTLDESCNLAAGNVFLGPSIDGAMLPVYEILRENLNNGVR
jgi:hypothetical protein